jgi:DNA modification methylase
MNLILGDCLEKLKELPDNSVDSIVTDPPYGLSFMNKKWDYDVPSVDIWKECLRVLKPGGHLLSFSGSRTYHRMAVRIEDAGFEIRDQIMWIYGSGFPKSHNVGNGIGTALKPAHEPIVLARKPLSEKTIAENVIKWGTGGLNIDDSRIEYKDDIPHSIKTERDLDNATGWADRLKRTEDWVPNNEGRWPANIMFDEEPNEQWGKYFYYPKASKKDREDMNNHPTVKPTELMLYLIKLVTPKGGLCMDPYMGSGSTGKACVRGGYDFIGIEREEEYYNIAKARI